MEADVESGFVSAYIMYADPHYCIKYVDERDKIIKERKVLTVFKVIFILTITSRKQIFGCLPSVLVFFLFHLFQLFVG